MLSDDCSGMWPKGDLNWDKETGHIALFGWLFYIVTATLDVYERYWGHLSTVSLPVNKGQRVLGKKQMREKQVGVTITSDPISQYDTMC